MKTNFVRVIAFLFVLGLGLSFSACVNDPAQGNSATNTSIAKPENCPNAPCSSENKSIAEKEGKQTACQNPLIVASAFDQSGSMKWSGTAPTTAEDLKPLLKHIANCGGELGITFVRSNSAKPIERFRATEPPSALVEPTPKPDEEDYEFADSLDEYNQTKANRDETIRQNQSALQPQMDEYLNILKPLLAQKPNGGTDFWSAINRLDVFLGEPDSAWNVHPHRYLIIISDAEDTAGKTKNSFKANATIFWVNATASDKTMKDLPFKRCENFQAAVSEILAREKGGK